MCRVAASNWNGEGSSLFTSSTAAYDCSDNGFCSEVLVLWALYYTAYKCRVIVFCLLLNFVGAKSTPFLLVVYAVLHYYFLLILQTETFGDSYRKKLNINQEKKIGFQAGNMLFCGCSTFQCSSICLDFATIFQTSSTSCLSWFHLTFIFFSACVGFSLCTDWSEPSYWCASKSWKCCPWGRGLCS